MKVFILTLAFLGLSIVPSCTTFTANAELVETVGRPVALIQIKKYAEKKPKNKIKLIEFSEHLKDYTSDKELSIQDFAKLTKKVGLDSDWAIVLDSIYQTNKNKFDKFKGVEKVKPVALYLAKLIDDALLLVEAQK